MMKPYARVLEQTPGVSGWVVQQWRNREEQRYLLSDRPESERTVESVTTQIEIQHRHDDVQGEASLTLFGPDAELTRAQVEEAVFRASLQSNPVWSLPDPRPAPEVKVADAELAANRRAAMDGIQARVFDGVGRAPDVRLSSAEIFASHTEQSILTSTGMKGSSTGSSIMLDLVLLSGSGEAGTESQGSYRTRRVVDLDVEAIIERHARRARDSRDAELPGTFTGPVVMSEGCFRPMFSPFTTITSGWAMFRKMSPRSVGDSILGDRTIEGDRVNLISDPTLSWGNQSRPYDGDGLALARNPVIEDGVFRRPAISQRFAQYLDLPATGDWHNQVMPAGSTSMQDLLDPGNGRLLHVVEFSWLNPNARRGGFSTEVRLGYETSHAGTRIVRGGSLSGNVYDAFTRARFAGKTTREGSWNGPAAVRFENLDVSGA